jgi:hypothetical protein
MELIIISHSTIEARSIDIEKGVLIWYWTGMKPSYDIDSCRLDHNIIHNTSILYYHVKYLLGQCGNVLFREKTKL